jgi:hypothetical protein
LSTNINPVFRKDAVFPVVVVVLWALVGIVLLLLPVNGGSLYGKVFVLSLMGLTLIVLVSYVGTQRRRLRRASWVLANTKPQRMRMRTHPRFRALLAELDAEGPQVREETSEMVHLQSLKSFWSIRSPDMVDVYRDPESSGIVIIQTETTVLWGVKTRRR